MHEMMIFGISFELVGKQPAIILRSRKDDRFLIIWIGHHEAAAILMALQGNTPPRPMTHDLALQLLEETGAECQGVILSDFQEGVYFANLAVGQGESSQEIDCRPSDGIALVVRSGGFIRATDELLDEASVPFDPDGEDKDQVVQEFREFLDEVSPEDFSADES